MMSRWVRSVDVADRFGLGRGHDVGLGDPGLAFIHLCFGAKSWTRLPKSQHIFRGYIVGWTLAVTSSYACLKAVSACDNIVCRQFLCLNAGRIL